MNSLSVLIYLLPVYLLLWVVGVVLGFVYQRRLRALYPDLAARLHRGFLRKSVGSDLSATGFLLKAKYRTLDNRSFVHLAEVYRSVTLLWYVVFAATIGVMLWSATWRT